MFRLWGKKVKDSKIIGSETIEKPKNDTRTHNILNSVEELSKRWDISNPIWLQSNIRDIQKNRKTRFYSDNFIEDINFDYLEIQIIEE